MKFDTIYLINLLSFDYRLLRGLVLPLNHELKVKEDKREGHKVIAD